MSATEAPAAPPSAVHLGEAEGDERLALHTEAGTIEALHHPAEYGDAAVLWLPLGGPADGTFTRLGPRVARHGIVSLGIGWRYPDAAVPCLVDALFALAWLLGAGRRRIALVGHGFSGSVAIAAGAAVPRSVAGVAVLAPKGPGCAEVHQLAPRHLLLAHGLADEVVPPDASRALHRQAGEQRRLILYPACGHDFAACRAAVARDLTAWLGEVLD